jgi:predicted phage replisome organizer
MSRYYWLRLRTDFFEGDDIKVIESQENGAAYLIFWQKLLLKAIEQVEPGLLRYKEDIPYDEKILATITGADVDVVRSAIKLFVQLKMMEIRHNGDIWIAGVQGLIGSEGESARRMRALRDRRYDSKLLSSQCDGDVTKSDAQGDREIRVKSSEIREERKDSASASPPEMTGMEYPPDFESWWATYPRHKEKPRAFKRWRASIKEGATAEQLLVATKGYAEECRRKGTVEDYIKHPATFLSISRPWQDYLGPGAAREEVARLLKTCRACGKQSDTSGRDCPKCGEPDAFVPKGDSSAA